MPKFRVGVAIEGGVTLHIDAKDEDDARMKVMELCDLGADVAIDGVTTDTVHREYFVTDVDGASG